jgi:hypothetical protein
VILGDEDVLYTTMKLFQRNLVYSKNEGYTEHMSLIGLKYSMSKVVLWKLREAAILNN